ncbi:hypothetical protein JCM10212_002395 [Sporobolomyces blumeae]
MEQFASFRLELDRSQAQRERIVKLSRDVTALSKQMIFALHRVASGKPWSAVRGEVEGKMDDLGKLFAKLQDEVRGEDFWRYERSVSPGLQEYLEGFTFYYYLQHRTLPTLAECQASLLPRPTSSTTTSHSNANIQSPESTPFSSLTDPAPVETELALEPYVLVSPEDYLGGVADLTGELMRLAIASVGKNLQLSLASSSEAKGKGADTGGEESFADIDKIGRLVREIKGQMDPLAPYARWLNKKLTVLDQSLGKIENASYNLRIRGAEYKDSPKMLQELAKRMATDSGPPRGGEGDVANLHQIPNFASFRVMLEQSVNKLCRALYEVENNATRTIYQLPWACPATQMEVIPPFNETPRSRVPSIRVPAVALSAIWSQQARVAQWLSCGFKVETASKVVIAGPRSGFVYEASHNRSTLRLQQRFPTDVFARDDPDEVVWNAFYTHRIDSHQVTERLVVHFVLSSPFKPAARQDVERTQTRRSQ